MFRSDIRRARVANSIESFCNLVSQIGYGTATGVGRQLLKFLNLLYGYINNSEQGQTPYDTRRD
jgi:hypothetical protein